MKKYSFVFCLVALVMAATLTTLAQDSKEVRKTVSLSSGGEVIIDTFKGSVTVTTWDGSQVDIHAKVEPDGASADNRKMVEDTQIHIETVGNSIRIKSDYDKLEQRSSIASDFDGSFSLPFIHYTIKVPRATRLTIDDHKSKISVSDLQADLRIDSHKGSITVARHSGAVNLETHKGDARVEFVSFGKQSSFDTHKGEIEILIPGQTGFDLDSEMGKGGKLDSTYNISSLRGREDKHEEHYRGSVNGGGPLLRLNSHKGQIRLRQQ